MKKVSDFKDRLNEAMELRNMKAIDLCRKTGISESTISQYRSGYAKPKEKKLALIADALGVSPTWLMGLDVPMAIRYVEEMTSIANLWRFKLAKGEDVEELRIAKAYSKAPKHIQDAIKSLLQIEEDQ